MTWFLHDGPAAVSAAVDRLRQSPWGRYRAEQDKITHMSGEYEKYRHNHSRSDSKHEGHAHHGISGTGRGNPDPQSHWSSYPEPTDFLRGSVRRTFYSEWITELFTNIAPVNNLTGLKAVSWSWSWLHGLRFRLGSPSAGTFITADPTGTPTDPSNPGFAELHAAMIFYCACFRYLRVVRMGYEYTVRWGAAPLDPSAISQNDDLGTLHFMPWSGEPYIIDPTTGAATGTIMAANLDSNMLSSWPQQRTLRIPRRGADHMRHASLKMGIHPVQPVVVTPTAPDSDALIIEYPRLPTLDIVNWINGDVCWDGYGVWGVWNHPAYFQDFGTVMDMPTIMRRFCVEVEWFTPLPIQMYTIMPSSYIDLTKFVEFCNDVKLAELKEDSEAEKLAIATAPAPPNTPAAAAAAAAAAPMEQDTDPDEEGLDTDEETTYTSLKRLKLGREVTQK
jgi:hypothetical protein